MSEAEIIHLGIPFGRVTNVLVLKVWFGLFFYSCRIAGRYSVPGSGLNHVDVLMMMCERDLRFSLMLLLTLTFKSGGVIIFNRRRFFSLT